MNNSKKNAYTKFQTCVQKAMSFERTNTMDTCIWFEEDFIECIERGRMDLTIIPSF
jgi:hypothetical protein